MWLLIHCLWYVQLSNLCSREWFFWALHSIMSIFLHLRDLTSFGALTFWVDKCDWFSTQTCNNNLAICKSAVELSLSIVSYFWSPRRFRDGRYFFSCSVKRCSIGLVPNFFGCRGMKPVMRQAWDGNIARACKVCQSVVHWVQIPKRLVGFGWRFSLSLMIRITDAPDYVRNYARRAEIITFTLLLPRSDSWLPQVFLDNLTPTKSH